MQHQSCFYSRADSPLDENCRLTSDSSGGSEKYSLWRCLCGVSGCNNVSVISSLDTIRVNVNRSSAEIRPTSTIGVNYSTTEIDGYQEQVFHYGLCKCSRRERGSIAVQKFFPKVPLHCLCKADLLQMCSYFFLSSAAPIIAIWTGVLIVAVIIVATIGALFGWVCLHHKKPKSIEQE